MLRSIALVAALGLAPVSFAATITQGTFNITGEIFVTGSGGVTVPGVGMCPVGVACIFWQDTDTPPNNNKADIGNAGLPNGNIPAAMAGNDAANIFNMMNPPEVVDASGFSPTPFISFNNAGITTILELNFIPAGIDGAAGCTATPPAAGQLCTPTGSLFNLQNLTASSSTVGWRLQGVTNDSASTWSGTFTSQFNTLPFQTVLANLAADGFEQASYSASITLTAVPEPETLDFLVIGSGLIGLAIVLQRLTRARVNRR